MLSARPSVRSEIERLGPWFHNLHLPDGSQTAPDHTLGDFPSFKWQKIAPYIPLDLAGWNVLDIGCNAGFYSFQLAARGATVTGIDTDLHYLAQAEWAAAQFGLQERTRFLQRSVYDLDPDAERYDLVVFMGVLYHLRYPLLGLDLVARTVRRCLLFQTLTMPGQDVINDHGRFGLRDREILLLPGWPRMAFLEHEFADDPTNWWVPNHAAVEAMLRSTGLDVVERPGHEIYLCAPRPDFAFSSAEELRAATGRRGSAGMTTSSRP